MLGRCKNHTAKDSYLIYQELSCQNLTPYLASIVWFHFSLIAMYELSYNSGIQTVTLKLSGSLIIEDFRQAWCDALDLVERKQVHRFLIDARKHLEIPVDNKMWFKEEFLTEANRRLSRDVKIARISSRYQENRAIGVEILRYIRSQEFCFNLHLFKDYLDAMDWLLMSEEEFLYLAA